MVPTSTPSPKSALARGLNFSQTRLTRGAPWKVGTRNWLIAAGFALALTPVGCRRSGLAVSGDDAHVRCLAARAPSLDGRRIGAVSLKQSGRALELKGLEPPLTIAAFSGPAFAAAPGKAELEALRAAKPQVVIVLGGLGDDRGRAQANLAALAELSVPTLILAGGRDRSERIEDALDALGDKAGHIIDITALRSVRFANDTWIPVAGAHEGWYALDAHSCGYGPDDLRDLASELEVPEGSRRWLLAWEAPRAAGVRDVASTEDGVALGSAALAEFAAKVKAGGGLFAWPEVQVLRPSAGGGQRRLETSTPAADLRLVVPRLTGPAMERSDGSRALPGFALLRLDAQGLQLLPAAAVK
jgi:hypothetical protein